MMFLLLDIGGVMVPANSWRRPEQLVQTSASVGLTDYLADEVLALAEKSNREFV